MAYHPELPFNSVCQIIAASNNIRSQIVIYLDWPTYLGTIPLNHLIDHGLIKISHIAKVSRLKTRPTEYSISTNSASPSYGGSPYRLSRRMAKSIPCRNLDIASIGPKIGINARAKKLKPIACPRCPCRHENWHKRKGKKVKAHSVPEMPMQDRKSVV